MKERRNEEPLASERISRFLLIFMNNDDLKYAIENGIINLSHIQEQIEMNKREEILKDTGTVYGRHLTDIGKSV